MKQILTFLFVSILVSCTNRGGDKGTVNFQPLDMGQEVNVSCFTIEPNGSIWMGLDGRGLAYKESATTPVKYFNKLAGTLPADVILCSYRAHDGCIWFGTFGNGVFFRADGAFHQPDNPELRTGKLEYISAFAEDYQGRMWIGTLKGGVALVDSTGGIRYLDVDSSKLGTNNITDLKTFDRRTIYVATGWGLFAIDSEKGDVSPVCDGKNQPFLEKQLVRILYPDTKGKLWIGTSTGLYIYDTKTKNYDHLTTKDGLADNYVKAIGQDQHGNTWLTSEHAITRVAAEDHHCQPFYAKDGIGEVVFHVRAVACNTDGDMLFGSSKGCLVAKNTNGVATDGSGNNIVWVLLAAIIIIGIAAGALLLRRKKATPAQYSAIETTPVEVSSADETLKERAIHIVEENISDTDFSVEQLSDALGMSRANLYKKLVSITGKSPIEFIRIIRLKRGKQLLEQSGDSISQIAWSIGMSPKQFSKYFKEEYGILPSDFLKSKS